MNGIEGRVFRSTLDLRALSIYLFFFLLLKFVFLTSVYDNVYYLKSKIDFYLLLSSIHFFTCKLFLRYILAAYILIGLSIYLFFFLLKSVFLTSILKCNFL